ncbi:Di-and tricarboxylate transporter [Alkalispirochaeta americana]|uniref:Di-and tricarboxylate transporter n=1 Tax=Alkalispirochaeta americana TaxID=159291 RepID=A0A1N6QHJ0_9SPIO|nr:SLC13 family permease [Alkalispirochaeta americana]SIQ15836.1 Di-and tricarboxylate transporter [Alkalispirochaeta americana]
MYITLAILVLIFLFLAFDVAGADMVFGAALILLLFTGVLAPREALAGFSNKGMATVGLLFIVSRAVENTGIFQAIAHWFLSGERASREGSSLTREKGQASLPVLMVKMMAPVTFLSAFLNNTPIVTIFAPTIKNWATAKRLPVSKFLIPLSYASIFGGICTLIGTSTNLVVHGLMLQNGLEGLGFFEVARAGLPIAVVGYLYLFFLGQRLLPNRQDVLSELDEDPREYFIEMIVPAESPLIGKTIEQAQLRSLQGVYLTSIERDGTYLAPITPDRRLAPGDRLFFAGRTDGVSDLMTRRGLLPVDQETLAVDTRAIRRHLVEVVVSSTSPVLGRSVRDANFRSRYDAAVVAVSRKGERVNTRLGDVTLHPGDTLVLLARGGFVRRYRFSRDFFLVSPVEKITPPATRKGVFALATVTTMILLSAFGGFLPELGGNRIDMFYAAAGAALVLVAGKVISPEEAREAIRWDVLITIAAAFGVSQALINSGTAEMISRGMVNLFAPFGTVGAVAAVYLMTCLFTELITNNAAAALVVPIAFEAARYTGISPVPFMVAVAMGASASFATPIGYQTNLIVQGPGSYRFLDFLRVGIPLSILTAATGITAIVLWYGV